jgi:dihydroxyacid dehydratase/phosphogluconate dehydratase
MRSVSHRARSRQLGYSSEDFAGKPVIGIVNTWSDMNTCHGHFPQRVEQIKRGVLEAGGFPVELPAMSLGEIFVKPSTCCTAIFSPWKRKNFCAHIRSTARC